MIREKKKNKKRTRINEINEKKKDFSKNKEKFLLLFLFLDFRIYFILYIYIVVLMVFLRKNSKKYIVIYRIRSVFHLLVLDRSRDIPMSKNTALLQRNSNVRCNEKF